ncbi:molybdopterin dinucleotide binding domain-containing protein [Nocardia testacea]|uniref:molybdopterin dinucleotide binding domain-containing protein n=1 Tax=Nocardia testacea TaxID=248551 RepID=UPI0033F93869
MRGARIPLDVPELLEWLAGLEPAEGQPDPAFPLSLIGGQRRSHNANQILRPPAWRRTDPDGALRARAEDLAAVGAEEGDWVAVVSRTGRVVARARGRRHAPRRSAGAAPRLRHVGSRRPGRTRGRRPPHQPPDRRRRP